MFSARLFQFSKRNFCSKAKDVLIKACEDKNINPNHLIEHQIKVLASVADQDIPRSVLENQAIDSLCRSIGSGFFNRRIDRYRQTQSTVQIKPRT